MTRLSDLDFYSSPWLTAADLGGRAVRVTIIRWAIEDVRQRDGSTARKVALSFAGKRKRLLLNMTQGRAAAGAFGEEIERWIGKQCILQPARADNGKDTIDLIALPAEGQSAPEAPGAPQEHFEGKDTTEAPPATAQPQQQGEAATAS